MVPSSNLPLFVAVNSAATQVAGGLVFLSAFAAFKLCMVRANTVNIALKKRKIAIITSMRVKARENFCFKGVWLVLNVIDFPPRRPGRSGPPDEFCGRLH